MRSEVSRHEHPAVPPRPCPRAALTRCRMLQLPWESEAEGCSVGGWGQRCATWLRKWESPKGAKTAPMVREDCQCCFEKQGAVPRGELSKGTGR